MLTTLRTFVIYWLPLIAYCLFIFIQSSYPPPEKLPSITYLDKVLHFFGYGVLGILFLRAYKTFSCSHRKQRLMLLSLASATLYGISDEVHQHFVPYRHADIFDVVADFIGAACGIYLYQMWYRSRQSNG